MSLNLRNALSNAFVGGGGGSDATKLPLSGGTLTGPLTITGGTVTASTPLVSTSQSFNNAAVSFHLEDYAVTATALAAGSTVLNRKVGGVSVVSVAYNTTGGNEVSPWRLVFGTDASVGWASPWSAISFRNAENTANVNIRAATIQATTAVLGTSFLAVGTGSEGDAELSEESWRTPGLRLKSTGSVVWTSTGTCAGADRNFIRSGSGTPEGAITASVGSMWLRTDGGANTTLYIKESGTGNTGWIAK